MKIKLLIITFLVLLLSSCGDSKYKHLNEVNNLEVEYTCTGVGLVDYCRIINYDNSVCYLAIGGANTVALDCLEDK